MTYQITLDDQDVDNITAFIGLAIGFSEVLPPRVVTVNGKQTTNKALFDEYLQRMINALHLQEQVYERDTSDKPAWKPVEGSSRISAIAFDESKQEIYVRFHSGKEWRYGQCSKDVWEDFSQAESMGSYIHSVLDSHPHGELIQETSNG